MKKFASILLVVALFAITLSVFASDAPDAQKEVTENPSVESFEGSSGGGGSGPGHCIPQNMDLDYNQSANIEQGRFQSSTEGTREQEAFAVAGNINETDSGYRFDSCGINGVLAGGGQFGAGNAEQGQKEEVSAYQYFDMFKNFCSSDLGTNFSANVLIAGEQEVNQGYATQENFALAGNAGQNTSGYANESHLSLVGALNCQEINGKGQQYQESTGYAYGNIDLEKNFWNTSLHNYSSANLHNYQTIKLECGSASQFQVSGTLNVYETSVGSVDSNGASLSIATQSAEIVGAGESWGYQDVNAYQNVNVSTGINCTEAVAK